MGNLHMRLAGAGGSAPLGWKAEGVISFMTGQAVSSCNRKISNGIERKKSRKKQANVDHTVVKRY